MKQKFLNDVQYLKDETLYKILWSMLTSGEMAVSPGDPSWQMVKDKLTVKAHELSPKILADLIVLSTQEHGDAAEAAEAKDLFSMIEIELIKKMKMMSLDDLINLMWSVIEVEKGGPVFYEKLETEIAKRIRGIKDE